MNKKALPPSLAELLPDADFRFHLTLRRGELVDFFRPQDSTGQVLDERRHWLRNAPERYLGLRPEGKAMVQEFAEVVASWPFARASTTTAGSSVEEDPARSQLAQLGESFEPDFALLAADAGGNFRLQAGAVCFPTGWALTEKLGLTLDEIHGVVPGLNPVLGSPIQQFLSRLKPGPTCLRSNWGIAASSDLNLHPARKISPPRLPLQLDQLWLRVENQALAVLPRTAGVVFAIRIERFRLDVIQADASVARGLHRALSTMTEAVVRYKALAEVHESLLLALKKS